MRTFLEPVVPPDCNVIDTRRKDPLEVGLSKEFQDQLLKVMSSNDGHVTNGSFYATLALIQNFRA